jgi:hypothetical protein
MENIQISEMNNTAINATTYRMNRRRRWRLWVLPGRYLIFFRVTQALTPKKPSSTTVSTTIKKMIAPSLDGVSGIFEHAVMDIGRT